MNPRRTVSQSLITALVCCSFGSRVDGATLNQWFGNDTETNAIYLWLDDSSAATTDITSIFFNASSGDMRDWTVFDSTSDSAFLTGPVADPNDGRFRVSFSYATTPFSLQWAEVLWSGSTMTLQGAGTLTRSGGWTASDTFTHTGDIIAPVPLPSSLILLLSVVLFTITHRRTRAPSTTHQS